MKFIRKRKVVEAVQFNVEDCRDKLVWNGFDIYTDEDLGLPYVLVNTADGVKRVEGSEWVVTHENGSVSVMQPDEFAREYVEYKNPEPPVEDKVEPELKEEKTEVSEEGVILNEKEPEKEEAKPLPEDSFSEV